MRVIVPQSGLGNRMRVVASVCALAADSGWPMKIVWRATQDCHAWFDQLFLPLNAPLVEMTRGTLLDAPATKHNLLLPYLYRWLAGYVERRCYRPSDTGSFVHLAQAEPGLYVDTCYSLYPYPSESVASLFRPLPHLQARINGLVSHFGDSALGVHVRRTDNKQATQQSPLSAFRRAIDKKIDEGEAETIYLATDSEEVKDYMRHAYGNRLICMSHPSQRHTLAGMEDAVVELWSLAQTRHILGSYYSSFSDTAAELFGRPLQIIRNEH